MGKIFREHMNIKFGLFIVLVLLNLIDTASTIHVINAYGTYDVEQNPVVRWMLEVTDTTDSLWFAKLLVVGVVLVFLERISIGVMVFLCLLLTAVVANNLWLIHANNLWSLMT